MRFIHPVDRTGTDQGKHFVDQGKLDLGNGEPTRDSLIKLIGRYLLASLYMERRFGKISGDGDRHLQVLADETMSTLHASTFSITLVTIPVIRQNPWPAYILYFVDNVDAASSARTCRSVLTMDCSGLH